MTDFRPGEDDPGPLSPGNRWFLWVFCILLFGLFAADLIDGYRTVKLGALFFVLFWVPLTALHELGHALMARAFGWRVHELVVGFGPTVARWRLGATAVELRRYPIGGYVRPSPQRLARARTANALIYLAGPGIELVAAWIVAAAVGWEALLSSSDAVGVIAAQSFVAAATLGAAVNLIPMTGPGGVPNDGLGFLSSPFLTEDHLRRAIAAGASAAVDPATFE